MFNPWVGSQYNAGAYFGQRILLVGESHNGTESDEETTRYVVQQVCSGKRIRFFTSIGYSCVGREMYDFNPARFWHSVAFMNFVQEPVPTNKDRPTTDMIQKSIPNFLKTLDDLEPDKVLLFSDCCWDELPAFTNGPKGQLTDSEDDYSAFGCYDGKKQIYVMYARHPMSRGWKLDHWRKRIAAFLSGPVSQQMLRAE